MSVDASWRDRMLVQACRFGIKPVLALPLPWIVHRGAAHLLSPLPPGAADVSVARRDIGGVPCRVYTPKGATGVLLWLHGGGFVLGSSRGLYGSFATTLARRSGRRVILPDYRLAPEHPFPAAPDDCLAVAQAVAAEGAFALGGDSAGGNLALVTLAQLLALGAAPDRLLLASPAVDLDPDRVPPVDAEELVLPKRMLRRVVRDYLAGTDFRDPRVSPLFASFDGAPPVLIQCAERELLAGDTDAIATHLARAGAEVTVQKERDVPHVWQLFAGRTPKADRAVDAMVDFLR